MLIPMSLVQEGSLGIIKSLAFGKDLSQKLFDLGIVPEARFYVLQKSYGIIIKLNEIKLALDKNFCSKVMVELIS